MRAMKLALITGIAAAAVVFGGCAPGIASAGNRAAEARNSGASVAGEANPGILASDAEGGKGPTKAKGNGNSGDDGPGGSKANGNQGRGKGKEGNPGNGLGKSGNDPAAGDNGNRGRGQEFTGWQRGRFKDVFDFPFAYPSGWTVQERDDDLVLTGEWSDRAYVVEVTRAMRTGSASFDDWVAAQLDQLGVHPDQVEYGTVGRVQAAVVSDVNLSGYDCPVARAFLWTQNPAGRNQRAVVATVSQAPGEPCDPDAVESFVFAFASQALEGDLAQPAGATPRSPATPSPTHTPAAAATGWQRNEFGPLTLPVPEGWTITGQGNTTVAQGAYEGETYIIQAVPYNSLTQRSLRDWVGSEAGPTGFSGNQVQYFRLRGIETAVVRHIDRDDDLYRCPVTRAYLWLGGANGGGNGGMVVTVAQTGLQTCDTQALDDFVNDLLAQAGRQG